MPWAAVAAAAISAVSSKNNADAASSRAEDARIHGIQDAVDIRNSNNEANRVDQVNPFGTSTWSTGPDGRPVQTTALNPAQQTLLDQQNQTATNIGDASAKLSADVNPMLSKGLNTTGMPAWQNVIGTGATNLMTHDWLANAANTVGGAVADAGTKQSTQATTNPVGNYTYGGNMGGGGGSGSVRQLSGGSGGGSGGSAAAVDPYKIRDTFDVSSVTNKLPTGIDDTSRQRVEEALMSRLNPQLANDTAALRSRLLNSGIEVGTDAYNRELALDAQKGTDARMQAILAGGQEEDRQTKLLQGLNDQQFQQALATGKFGQDADMAMAANATSRSNAATAAGAVTGAAGINNAGAMERLQAQLGQQSKEFNVVTGFKAAEFNNNLRNQQMAEQVLMRQEPLKELTAMRELSKPNMPTFANYYSDSARLPGSGGGNQGPVSDPIKDTAGNMQMMNNMWNMKW